MTIVNFAMTPERALMAADTLVYGSDHGLRRHPDGSPVERSKLLPLHHAKMIIGCVGDVWLSEVIYRESSRLVNIDTAIDHIAQTLRNVLASGERRFAGLGGWVQMVGWSQKHGRLISSSLCSQLDWQPFTITGVEQWTEARPPALGLYPSENQPAVLQFPDTPEAMTAVAHWQRNDYPEITGGRLLFAELTEHEIRLFEGPDLGLPKLQTSATEGAIGANAATEVYQFAVTGVRPSSSFQVGPFSDVCSLRVTVYMQVAIQNGAAGTSSEYQLRLRFGPFGAWHQDDLVYTQTIAGTTPTTYTKWTMVGVTNFLYAPFMGTLTINPEHLLTGSGFPVLQELGHRAIVEVIKR